MNCYDQKLVPVRVDVRDVRKAFNGNDVLRGITFSVEPGEIFGIMGPSGAGKSVLLRHIIGLMQPDSGQVLIEGAPAADPETHRKFVTAIVFQDGALFNSMSVYDNLALYPRSIASAQEGDRRAHPARARDAQPAQCRPTDAQRALRRHEERVAVARALMMQPHLLLYDEPTSELDPELGATIAELIAAVRAETGLTSIVVTHDRELARNIADRVVLLRDGAVAFSGTAKELTASKDPAVQAFLNPKIDPENPRFRLNGNGNGHRK
jgi:phospholipid/cholesterol/gamma-HCH transport system ATP-binding protein